MYTNVYFSYLLASTPLTCVMTVDSCPRPSMEVITP